MGELRVENTTDGLKNNNSWDSSDFTLLGDARDFWRNYDFIEFGATRSCPLKRIETAPTAQQYPPMLRPRVARGLSIFGSGRRLPPHGLRELKWVTCDTAGRRRGWRGLFRTRSRNGGRSVQEKRSSVPAWPSWPATALQEGRTRLFCPQHPIAPDHSRIWELSVRT